MANYRQAIALILPIAFVLIIHANGQAWVKVTGQVCCSPSGSCTTSTLSDIAGLGNANVALECGSGVLASGTTLPTGQFSIVHRVSSNEGTVVLNQCSITVEATGGSGCFILGRFIGNRGQTVGNRFRSPITAVDISEAGVQVGVATQFSAA